MKRVLWLLALLFTCTPVLGTDAWKHAARGLDVLEARFPHHPGGGTFGLLAVRADAAHYRLRVLASPDLRRAVRSDDLRRQTRAVLVVNGPFFDTDGRAMGLVVSAGRVLQRMPPPSPANGAVLAVKGGKVWIAGRDALRLDGVTEAVQCAPRLLADGQATSGILDADRRSPRTVVALTRDGHILVVCTTSWADGASFTEMQDALRRAPFDAVDAMALDGGRSSQMSLKAGKVQRDLPGVDPVPVSIGLFRRDASRTVNWDF